MGLFSSSHWRKQDSGSIDQNSSNGSQQSQKSAMDQSVALRPYDLSKIRNEAEQCVKKFKEVSLKTFGKTDCFSQLADFPTVDSVKGGILELSTGWNLEDWKGIMMLAIVIDLSKKAGSSNSLKRIDEQNLGIRKFDTGSQYPKSSDTEANLAIEHRNLLRKGIENVDKIGEDFIRVLNEKTGSLEAISTSREHPSNVDGFSKSPNLNQAREHPQILHNNCFPTLNVERRRVNVPKASDEKQDPVSQSSESINRFEEELKDMESDSKSKEDRARMEKLEKDKKQEMEFREKLARQDEESEEALRNLQKEIEDFEEETQRIINQGLEEIRATNAAFFQCVLLMKHWKEEELKFAEWLNTLRNPITRAKTRFSLFEKLRKKSKRVSKGELSSLHQCTLLAYDTVYEAWRTIQKLSKEFPDRIFLFILLRILVEVSDKLYGILESIDNCKSHQGSVGHIHSGFENLDALEIPQTWKLREQSEKESEDTFNFNGEPNRYTNNI